MNFSPFGKRGLLLLWLRQGLAIDSLLNLMSQLRSDIADLRQEIKANSHFLRTKIMASVAELTSAVQELKTAWDAEKSEILSKIAELENAIESSEIPASLLEQIQSLTSDIRSTVETPAPLPPVVAEEAIDVLPPNTTEGANAVLGDQPVDDNGF